MRAAPLAHRSRRAAPLVTARALRWRSRHRSVTLGAVLPPSAPASYDRGELLDLLSGLRPAQFEELLFRLDIRVADISSEKAAQTTRAIEVVRLMEQREAGLVELAAQIRKIAPGPPAARARD